VNVTTPLVNISAALGSVSGAPPIAVSAAICPA
jgi:hypothetical protein